MCAKEGPVLAIVQLVCMFITAMMYATIFVTRREFTLVRTEEKDEKFELKIPSDEEEIKSGN